MYTSKKTSFVITALLCDLFTSICIAAAYIHTYKVSHPSDPPKKKNPVCNPDILSVYFTFNPVFYSFYILQQYNNNIIISLSILSILLQHITH